MTVAIESNDGKTVFAPGQVSRISQELEEVLRDAEDRQRRRHPTTNRFVISTEHPGTLWLSLVSLFPPTYKNRPNGNRVDLMELFAAMKPAFLRFPGGNYLEGPNYENRFNWKETIGPIEQRPTHMARGGIAHRTAWACSSSWNGPRT